MKITITIISLLFCFTLASQESENKPTFIDTTLSISDDELKELEQKLVSEDPSFKFKFLSEKDVSFFLEAQKKRPQNFIWCHLIEMCFANDKYEARSLNDNERKILFENALQYLNESLETLQKANLTNSNNKEYIHTLRSLKGDIAFASVEAGELDSAKKIAEEMLTNNVDTESWNYSNIIHNANTILGRVALQKNDLKKAKEHLIKSVEIPSSPQLNSFGPSCILARELLERGEKTAVLDYLDLVARFWTNTRAINYLDKWKDEILMDKIPNDPRW